MLAFPGDLSPDLNYKHNFVVMCLFSVNVRYMRRDEQKKEKLEWHWKVYISQCKRFGLTRNFTRLQNIEKCFENGFNAFTVCPSHLEV